jgi:hypothetical protein
MFLYDQPSGLSETKLCMVQCVVTDEHGAMVECWLSVESPRNWTTPAPLRSYRMSLRLHGPKMKFCSRQTAPTGWVIALPGRIARGEIKGQTEKIHAVSRLATGWTARGSNTGRSNRVSFLKKRSHRLWNPPSALFNGYWSVFPGW